jgi:hypothetical protein
MVDEIPRSEPSPDRTGDAAGLPRNRFERVFEVSVNGLVPAALLAELGDVDVSSQAMRTVLTGHFRDQSEVYGFLERLRASALEVVEVRQVTGRTQTPEPESGGS